MSKRGNGNNISLDGGQGGTAEQQAYLLVKTRIMEMYYKPGQYVVDSELADELAISRTPIANASWLAGDSTVTGRYS